MLPGASSCSLEAEAPAGVKRLAEWEGAGQLRRGCRFPGWKVRPGLCPHPARLQETREHSRLPGLWVQLLGL